MKKKIFKIFLASTFLLLAFLLGGQKASAAGCTGTGNCFWVGGTGNTNGTTKWATSSGGVTTGGLPSAADNCIFDTLSNATAYTVTVNATLSCLSVTIGNPATGVITLTGGFQVNVSGNFTFASGMTNTWNGGVTFNATSGTKTITSNGVTWMVSTFIINGSGGTFRLADNLTFAGNQLTFSAGTFDATTNNTTFTTTGSALQITVTVPPTFYNLTVSPASPAKTNSLTLTGNITVSNLFTVSDGATATNRVFITSNIVFTGFQRTITAASVSISNADFRAITGAGAASWNMSSATGGSGDCGGNVMQALGASAFTTAADQHWINASGGNWSTAANWTSRVPLCQDNVFFDNAFGTAQTVTNDMPRLGKSIDWTGATWTTSLTWALNISATSYGSLTLISGLTISGSSDYFLEGRGNFTISTNTVTFPSNISVSDYSASPGTYSLGSDLNIASNKSLVLGGSFGNFSCVNGGNNYAMSAGGIYANLSEAVGTLTLGSATHIITGNVSMTSFQWNMGSSVVTTLNAGTSTIKFTNTTNAQDVGFQGGALTYNNVWFSRGSSTGANRFIGSSNGLVVNTLKDDGTIAHELDFQGSQTVHVTHFLVSGSAGNVISLKTFGGGTSAYTVVKDGGGVVSSNYLNIQHFIASPGTGTWYAGANSVNNQAVSTAGSGWIFTVPPTSIASFNGLVYSSVKTIIGLAEASMKTWNGLQ